MSTRLPAAAYVTAAQMDDLGIHSCGAQSDELLCLCWRPKGHGGRHAHISDRLGLVHRCWGEDVHADARRRGREAITAKANERLGDVVALIAEGANPDDAWGMVESIAGIEPTC